MPSQPHYQEPQEPSYEEPESFQEQGSEKGKPGVMVAPTGGSSMSQPPGGSEYQPSGGYDNYGGPSPYDEQYPYEHQPSDYGYGGGGGTSHGEGRFSVGEKRPIFKHAPQKELELGENKPVSWWELLLESFRMPPKLLPVVKGQYLKKR